MILKLTVCAFLIQLQFYSLLNETGSPLKDTIPSLVASGIVLPDGKDYKVEPWNGYEDCSRVVEAHSVGMKRSRNISKLDKSRYRTNCSEAELAKVSIDDNAKDAEYNENQITGLNDETVFWPYIVHKRRDGTNMDRVCVPSFSASLLNILLNILADMKHVFRSFPFLYVCHEDDVCILDAEFRHDI